MTILVTGGAGFIGSNVAHRLLVAGEHVRILDNLSRPGVQENLAWLEENHRTTFEVVVADVRDENAVRRALHGVDHVFHFAAQVAVASSVADPRLDFDVNARGTLNVLEAIRAETRPPSLVFTSTSKVYGALDDLPLHADGERYAPADFDVAANGISEKRPLELHAPCGCSKGTADQYVLDYARTFGLHAAVLRASCVYGPRQLGDGEQGWVAHLLTRALRGEPITIYGDGKQVRDVLFVDDLVDALFRVKDDIARLSGRAFNVGGGPRNSISVRELVQRIEHLTRRPPRVSHDDWQRADRRWYVSDTRELTRATGWTAKNAAEEGVLRLFDWIEARL